MPLNFEVAYTITTYSGETFDRVLVENENWNFFPIPGNFLE